MINFETIFSGYGEFRHTDLAELIVNVVDPKNSLEERKAAWEIWQNHYYSLDDIMEFFQGVMGMEFIMDFLGVFTNEQNHKDFYSLVMSLDLSGLDPKAYYLFFILNYGHRSYTDMVRNALEFDPDTIHEIFPDIEKILDVTPLQLPLDVV